jgi:tRNA U34 2-thiouridine synthase MnmA/TrmU
MLQKFNTRPIRLWLATVNRSYTMGLIASQVNWIAFAELDAPIRATAKIRYKDTPEPCTITPLPNGMIQVQFDAPKRAITRGKRLSSTTSMRSWAVVLFTAS